MFVQKKIIQLIGQILVYFKQIFILNYNKNKILLLSPDLKKIENQPATIMLIPIIFLNQFAFVQSPVFSNPQVQVQVQQKYNKKSTIRMQIETPTVLETDPTILCPMCGIQFQPKLSTICQACMLAKTDITIGITKEAIINFCRFCHRYMRPPWIACERDSKELLAILLKKIKGLNRAKIINAGFVWTEEHSKRIKVKLTIEKELNNKTKVQQTFITEFIQAYMQCDDCKKQFTPHTWGAVVQVRQHVDHKKTFYYLQQLILKHGAYDKVLKVSQQDDGLNFYYKTTTHAQRLIDFLSSILPISIKNSKQLISHDESSNIFNYKYTFSVQIPRICRNDLVLIPKKLAKQLGGCSQLLLCYKIGQSIGFVDLNNFQYVIMNSVQYQHYERDIVMLSLAKYRREFQVLDCNVCDKRKFQDVKSTLNKFVKKTYMYNVTRRGQWENVEIKGTLGDIPCGQLVEGYDLRELSHSEDFSQIKGIQDIVLVRRFHDKQNKKRAFKLKKLQDQGVMCDQGQKKKSKKKMQQQQDADYQDFLNDVQADADLRKQVKLYKDQKALKNMTKQQLDEVLGQIQICELLDDMALDQKQKKNQGTGQGPKQEGEQLEGIDDLIARMDKVRIDKE